MHSLIAKLITMFRLGRDSRVIVGLEGDTLGLALACILCVKDSAAGGHAQKEQGEQKQGVQSVRLAVA